MPNANESVHPQWSHLEYRWELNKFWELRALACVEALEDEAGGLIWSQKFGDANRGLWQLKLYPYGDASPAGRGHVSLFLSLDLKSLEGSKAYAIFGCHLIDDKGDKVQGSGRSFTRQKFAEGSSSWGWSQFIKVEGQSLNKLLCPSNDSLVVRCEIDVFTGVNAAPSRALQMPPTWLDDIRSAIANPALHDVQIVLMGNGGRTFPANRTALLARSKKFLRLLTDQQDAFKSPPGASTAVASGLAASAAPVCGGAFQGLLLAGGLPASTSTESTMPSSATELHPDSHLGAEELSTVSSPVTLYASFGGLTDGFPPEESKPPSKAASIAADPAPPSGSAVVWGSGNSIRSPSPPKPQHAGQATSPSSEISVKATTMKNVVYIHEPLDVEAFENMLAYFHTDDCSFFGEATCLPDLMRLTELSRKYESMSLYTMLMRKLSGCLTNKANALAVQNLARRIQAKPLEKECDLFLLTCARELTDEELLRIILPKPQ